MPNAESGPGPNDRFLRLPLALRRPNARARRRAWCREEARSAPRRVSPLARADIGFFPALDERAIDANVGPAADRRRPTHERALGRTVFAYRTWRGGATRRRNRLLVVPDIAAIDLGGELHVRAVVRGARRQRQRDAKATGVAREERGASAGSVQPSSRAAASVVAPRDRARRSAAASRDRGRCASRPDRACDRGSASGPRRPCRPRSSRSHRRRARAGLATRTDSRARAGPSKRFARLRIEAAVRDQEVAALE